MPSYNIAGSWDYLDADGKSQIINAASDEDLAKWATDPDCNEKVLCATAINKRNTQSGVVTAKKLAEMQANPLDVRTEVSADARYIAGHIVKHLWIILVALPFVLAVLYGILK